MEQRDFEEIGLSISDHSQLGALQQFLSMVPGIRVTRVPGQPSAGEQGALDALTVLAGSGGVVAAVKVLPEFLRSRRTGLSISMTIRDKPFTLTATNANEIMPILDRLLDE